jgi:hypothetical protein
MSLSISDELKLFSQELRRYLSPHALQQPAKEVGFVQRSSKFQAQELVALFFFHLARAIPTSAAKYVDHSMFITSSACKEFTCLIVSIDSRFAAIWDYFFGRITQ